MENKVFCTIFTPTYNRKEKLEKLYDSLTAQEEKNFEWLIVDDGSTDNTEILIKEIAKKEKEFNIIYKKTENGGKHRAINYGLNYANGKVFAIVDSDDYLLPCAVRRIREYFEDIEKNKNGEIKFAGVAAQRGYNEEKSIGKTFDGKYIDAKSTERRKNNIEGDKFEIYYTQILRENRFPEIDGEKFMTEAIVWTRIAYKDYYLRWYNDIIYICEYLKGGLTDTREKLIEASPKGYALYIKEQVRYGNITLKQKLGYYSFYYKILRKHKKINEIANELETNSFVLYFSYLIRKIIEKLRNENGTK